MTYQEALEVITDWFHSYVDSNGERVHERHINGRYIEAELKLQELIDKCSAILETRKLYNALRMACDEVAWYRGHSPKGYDTWADYYLKTAEEEKQ